jgi:hypothetical protein
MNASQGYLIRLVGDGQRFSSNPRRITEFFSERIIAVTLMMKAKMATANSTIRIFFSSNRALKSMELLGRRCPLPECPLSQADLQELSGAILRLGMQILSVVAMLASSAPPIRS